MPPPGRPAAVGAKRKSPGRPAAVGAKRKRGKRREKYRRGEKEGKKEKNEKKEKVKGRKKDKRDKKENALLILTTVKGAPVDPVGIAVTAYQYDRNVDMEVSVAVSSAIRIAPCKTVLSFESKLNVFFIKVNVGTNIERTQMIALY